MDVSKRAMTIAILAVIAAAACSGGTARPTATPTTATIVDLAYAHQPSAERLGLYLPAGTGRPPLVLVLGARAERLPGPLSDPAPARGRPTCQRLRGGQPGLPHGRAGQRRPGRRPGCEGGGALPACRSSALPPGPRPVRGLGKLGRRVHGGHAGGDGRPAHRVRR